ncbi:MAG: hypothetical protein PVF74_06460 [Anaerolineales bacterium]|jgi:hypothetical protein
MIFTLGRGSVPPSDLGERVRAFTRSIEFNFVDWTLNALGVKFGQSVLNPISYLPDDWRRELALNYLQLVAQIHQGEAILQAIYTDPNISDPDNESAEIREQLNELHARRDQIRPLAEEVLQSQLTEIVADMDLSIVGQPLPPVLYHSTPLPKALIVSPRDVIRQEEHLSLSPDLTVDQHAALENQIDAALDVSSLVVGIGGIGLYPTMVSQTSDLNWLTEVVAHEWIHNFLTLRPLGMNYLTSPELRTMNETAASIAGKEIGRALMVRFYPELLPPPPPEQSDQPQTDEATLEPPPFDFRAEMRTTRLKVDELLAEGKIEEAEAYMEERRQFFWEHGYHIRKLNQAYFAFHGAYADLPGGAAGEDPVGAAVRTLRAQSPSLAEFLKRIAWMSSFEQLQEAIGDSGLSLQAENESKF